MVPPVLLSNIPTQANTPSEYIQKRIKESGEVFGGQKVQSLPAQERKEKAAELIPLIDDRPLQMF